MKKTFRRTRILLTLLIIGIIAGAAYAFTASNTVPATYAGDGNQAISGYTVSAVTYGLNGVTPTNIDTVGFTLDQSATTVKAKLVGGGSWYSCSNTSGNVWSCATTSPQATVTPANNLDVLAVQ
jgi:hypothetical protein